jgi:hypothetical protein
MEKKNETRKNIVRAVIVIAVIAGLMLTAHILVNYFNIVDIVRRVHGG